MPNGLSLLIKPENILIPQKIFYLYRNRKQMKAVRYLTIVLSLSFLVTSCSLFKAKRGCPSNGRNVGAEDVLNMTKKEQRKAGKFKA